MKSLKQQKNDNNIHKTLHRKQKIQQHEPHKKMGVLRKSKQFLLH
jgi:hypothetical protein